MKQLEIKLEVKNGKFVDVVPLACKASSTNCKFTKKTTKLRVVYDINFPYLLSIPILHCSEHKTSVGLLKHVLNAKSQYNDFICLVDGHPVPLVFLERMIITGQLYDHIIELYKETFGFENVASLLQSTWVNNLNTELKVVSNCFILLSYNI